MSFKESDIVQFPNVTLDRMTEKFVGQKYNGIEIIEILGKKNNKGMALVRAICSCGEKFISAAYDIKRGHTKSCGCLKMSHGSTTNLIHGSATHRKVKAEYKAWSYIKDKLLNNSDKAKVKYRTRKDRIGGPGVCDRWLEPRKGYLNFIEDMGEKPTEKSRLMIRDVTKPFDKDNCYWSKPGKKADNHEKD